MLRRLRGLLGRPDPVGATPGGATASLEVGEEGVRRQVANGTVEAVTWAELVQVRVVTTDAGPFGEDVFFVLDGAEGGVVVGQGETPEGLLERLQALRGFDNEELIRAMGSAVNAEFVCWRRAGTSA